MELSNWAKKIRINRYHRRMALSARLNKLNGEDLSDMVLAKITNVKLAMNIEVNMNELFWEKMASVNWIWLGD